MTPNQPESVQRRSQHNTTGKKEKLDNRRIIVRELAKNLRAISAEIMSSQASHGSRSSSSSDGRISGMIGDDIDGREARVLPQSLVKDAAKDQMSKNLIRASSLKTEKEDRGCLLM